MVAKKMHFLCSDGLISMVDLYFLTDGNGNFESHRKHLALPAMSQHAGRMSPHDYIIVVKITNAVASC